VTSTATPVIPLTTSAIMKLKAGNQLAGALGNKPENSGTNRNLLFMDG